MKTLLLIMSAVAAVPLLCACSTGGGSGGSAGSGGATVTTGCPDPPDGGWTSPDTLPSGPCAAGATCEVGLVVVCPGGSTVPGTHYGCWCEAGAWQCDINGGLNIVPCPDGGADGG